MSPIENYETSERGPSLVLEVPNPDPRGDAYFHGDNPHVVGFGSQTDGDVADERPSGEPDESWRNDDIRDYADEHDIHIPAGSNKAEMLEAIREG